MRHRVRIPLGSGVCGDGHEAEESQQDGGEEQHSSSHEWRFSGTMNGHEWRFSGLCLNGDFQVLEVGDHTRQEVVFGLYQLVFGHVVDVGGAAAACQHDGCSSGI